MKKRMVYIGVLLAAFALFAMSSGASNLLIKTLLIFGAKLMLILPFWQLARKYLPEISHRRGTFGLCAASLVLQFVLDAFRFYVSGGDSFVLFVPIALPLCYFAVMHAWIVEKGAGRGRKIGVYALGFLLFAAAVFFEITAFADVCV